MHFWKIEILNLVWLIDRVSLILLGMVIENEILTNDLVREHFGFIFTAPYHFCPKPNHFLWFMSNVHMKKIDDVYLIEIQPYISDISFTHIFGIFVCLYKYWIILDYFHVYFLRLYYLHLAFYFLIAHMSLSYNLFTAICESTHFIL